MGNFEVKRCALLFDFGLPGHGEATLLPLFLALSSRRGVSVTEFKTPRLDEYIWGERMNRRVASLFGWAKTVGGAPAPATFSRGSSERDVRTIQDALLRGYRVLEGDGELKSDWLTWWSSQYIQWRGVPVPVGQRAGTVPYDLVLTAVPADVLCSRYGESAPPDGSTGYFAIYFEPELKRITVARNAAAKPPFPKVDVMLDGHFTQGLWRQTGDGSWVIQKIVN